MGFFSKLKEGLTKTRDNIVSGIDSVFSGFSSIDDDFYDELEETLIMGDIGVVATEEILDDLKNKVKENKIKNPADCKQLLIDSIKEKMNLGENAYEFENRKSIVMLIGVNGVGKTTSVGKLAGLLKAQNKKVIMAAADTFRAAAIEQLTEWSNRTGADIIAQSEGSDPAAVIYDSIAACKARKADVLLCDTAGRLQNKKNLMEESILMHTGKILSFLTQQLVRTPFLSLESLMMSLISQVLFLLRWMELPKVELPLLYRQNLVFLLNILELVRKSKIYRSLIQTHLLMHYSM